VHQQWNDEDAHTDGQGHLSSMTERMRRHQAIWFSGLAGAGVDDYLTIVAGTIDLKIASGVGYQLHRHTIAAFDTSAGDVALVKNWSGDAYHNITNLFDIVADSTGAAIGNNKYFNLVVWSVTNSVGYNPVFINLPSGTYTSQVDAENDVDGMDDFTIPREFNIESSTGLLVCRLTVQNKNTTWEYKSTTDLRGTTPQTASGGAAGITTEFADNQFAVFNVTDTTKILELDVSAITTGTTRTWTVPDASGTVTIDGVLLDGTGAMTGNLDMGGNSILNADDIEVLSITPSPADITFYQADGLTVSLLWDESDGQWEFGDSITVAGDIDLQGMGSILGAAGVTSQNSDLALKATNTGAAAQDVHIMADDSTGGIITRARFYGELGDIAFFKLDGTTISLLWDESDDRWEFSTQIRIDQSQEAIELYGDDTKLIINFRQDGVNSSSRIGHVATASDNFYLESLRGDMLIRAINNETMNGADLVLSADDSTGSIRVRQYIVGTGDIQFRKVDGSTHCLLWDQSQDRWEFNSGDVLISSASRLDIDRGIALGGGAAPTLGTIGGTGPTAAAQAQWVEIDINGTAHWIPVWT